MCRARCLCPIYCTEACQMRGTASEASFFRPCLHIARTQSSCAQDDPRSHATASHARAGQTQIWLDRCVYFRPRRSPCGPGNAEANGVLRLVDVLPSDRCRHCSRRPLALNSAPSAPFRPGGVCRHLQWVWRHTSILLLFVPFRLYTATSLIAFWLRHLHHHCTSALCHQQERPKLLVHPLALGLQPRRVATTPQRDLNRSGNSPWNLEREREIVQPSWFPTMTRPGR